MYGRHWVLVFIAPYRSSTTWHAWCLCLIGVHKDKIASKISLPNSIHIINVQNCMTKATSTKFYYYRRKTFIGAYVWKFWKRVKLWLKTNLIYLLENFDGTNLWWKKTQKLQIDHNTCIVFLNLNFDFKNRTWWKQLLTSQLQVVFHLREGQII